MNPPYSSVAEELLQTRPYETRSEEALVAILRTAARLRRALAKRIEPFGISPAQYNVLRILRGAGSAGLPTLAVRDRLIEEAPGITRLIDKLETAGHVLRDRTGRDRRTVRIQITAEGLALLDQTDGLVREVHDLVNQGLPDQLDQHRLLELLADVRSHIR